jgi:hypothetical protein
VERVVERMRLFLVGKAASGASSVACVVSVCSMVSEERTCGNGGKRKHGVPAAWPAH